MIIEWFGRLISGFRGHVAKRTRKRLYDTLRGSRRQYRRTSDGIELLEDRRLLAGFTWEMTPRVVADANGRIAVPNNSAYANPSAFEVVFDGSSTSTNALTYTWMITPSTGGLNDYGGTASQPKFSTRVPEGTYDVKLTVNGSTSTQQIFVNDILVVTMGDSLSAGEGNPETTLDETNPVEWMQVGDTTLYPPAPDSGPMFNSADVEEEQARYHAISSRSSYAAGAQMALQLENADPHSSVTFVFVATSGSSIGSVPKDPTDKTTGGGALLPNFGQDVADGYDADDPMPSQIDQVKNIINDRGVEVLTFSFSINDVAFTRIAKAFLFHGGDFDSDFESKLDTALNEGTSQSWKDLADEVKLFSSQISDVPVGAGIEGLIRPATDPAPGGYAQLKTALSTLAGGAPAKVYMLEYMNILSEFTNTTVTTCDKIMEDLLPLAKVDSNEIAWAESRLFDITAPRISLNDAVAKGALDNGWTPITGIAAAFAGHGYCSSDDDRWVRRAEEAAQLQGPNKAMTTGTLHPNRRGQAKIGELLTQQVLTDLYTTVINKNAGAPLLADLITSSNNYFQKIIDSPLEGASGKHTLQDVLKDGLSGLFDLPVIREKVDFVDLDGLFNTILNDLGAKLSVESTSAPALTIPSGNGDASFMVTLDNLGPFNVRISPQTFNTTADLETELNAQLADAGFGDRLKAKLDTGFLVFESPSAESLSVATLQLRADAPAPANGRLVGPSVATQLTVDYQTGTGNLTYQNSQTVVSFTIDANVITYTDGTSTKTISTSANVDASDLADAINQVLKAKGLYDVVAIVDRGVNDMLDKNPLGLLLTDPNYPIATANRDRLVFAATTKSVTGIRIANAQLGFNSSTTAAQPLDQTSTNNNQNPAWTQFNFRGQSDVPGTYTIAAEQIPESLSQFIDLYTRTAIPSAAMKSELLFQLGSRLTASLNKLSLEATTDPFWPPGLPTAPANFTVAPAFTAGSGDRNLTFQVQVDHLFQKPFEWDLSNDGIKLGSLGRIEVGGTIEATLIAPTHLDLKLGMYLGHLVKSPLNAFNSGGVKYVGVPFNQNTPLRFLNAGKGIPLLVGITAPNAAPTTGVLAGDAAFVLTISKNTSTVPSIHLFNLKQFSTGNTSDPISSDNATPQNLADDLNSLFRKQGIHDLVRAAVLVEQSGSALTQRLYIHGIDSSVIGLTIAGSGGEDMGFATLQDSGLNISGMSKWADLEVKVGSSTYFVDLDHARTLQDVKFAIQIQTLGQATVSIDNLNQRLMVSSSNGTANVYVSGGQVIVGVSDRFATASALGILHENVPNSPALQAIVGQPLHGLGFDDRSYVDTSYTNEDISLGVGLVVDNTDVSAALGSISFDLVGNTTTAADASLTVFGTLNIKDVKNSSDHRLYLTEEFNSAREILALNILSGGLPCGITGHAEFAIGFSLVGDLTDSLLHNTLSVGDTVPIELDFSPTTNCGIQFKPTNPGSPSLFQSILTQAKNLDLDDLLAALKGVGNYFKSNPPEAFKLNIPLIDKTVGDVVNFADALINAADNFISKIDVDAVQQAVDAVGTAISNLNVPQTLHESRLRMLAAVDAIQRVLTNAADVDLDGTLRLEGRLIATVRQLYRTVVKETRDSNGVLLPTLNLQLVDTLNAALRTLIDQIPSFDTVKSQLEKAVSKSIADTFGVPVTTVTFTFDYIKDYDTNLALDQPAIAFGLTYDEANLVAVSGGDNWPLTVGGKQVQVTLGGATADFQLRAGTTLSIGAGITLQSPRKLFLIANSTNPDLTNTKIVVDAGLNAQVIGSLGYKSFDLVDATVTAAFRAATVDTWGGTGNPPVPALGSNLPLSLIPEGGLDPRLIIVTSFSSPGHVLKSSGATPTYTLTESPPGTFNLTILAWPPDQVETWPLGQTAPSRVTVEYLTAATANVANRANRASLEFKLDPNGCTSSFTNTIGAILLSDIPCAAALSVTGLLTADVDASVLNSSVDNMITLAISAQHPLQPQFDFDETLIDDLFQGIDFNLCLIVPSIEKFLLKLEDDVSHGALAKLPIAGKNIAQQTKVIKTLREEFAGPFLEYVCHDPSASGALDAAAATIQGWLNQNLRTALNLPLNSTDVAVVVTLTQDSFEIDLNVKKTETFSADFDSGLDGLPLKASGQGGVDVSLGFEIYVGFGLSKADGFYVKLNQALPELKIAASAKLQVGDASTANPIPTSLTVDLFGLDLSATDILTTSSSGLAETGTFIVGDISFNMNSGVAADGKLTISDLTTPLLSLIDPETPLVELDAQVHLALEAGLTTTLPSVQANLMLDWGFKLKVVGGEIVAVNEGFEFGFEDIGINLGDFLTRHIRPVLDQINKYIEPLQPIIDFLKSEIPGVTELSQAKGNGPVTFLDLALIRNPSQAKAAKKFINALDTIIRLARELKSGERDELVFILQEKLQLISSSGSNPSSTNLSDLDAADDVPLEDAKPDTGDSTEKSQGFVKRVLQSLEDMGVHLHILDVSNIISMLLHRPFDIVTYDIPRLDLAFSWEISFGIWAPPPIVARIGLDFNAFADLSIGYDSHGIDTGKFFDGFYFGDLQNGITGPDIDDFGLSLGVRLAALLQLAVASAGIEGEVRGDVLANWRDVDGDGKMHLDEMVRIVKQDGFSCLFDLQLDVHAIVRLVYSAVGFSGSYDFIDKIIFSLQQQCPKYELAHVVTDATGTIPLGPGAEEMNGTLVINVGPFAGNRRRGNTSDGPEDVIITQLAPNVMQVEVLGLMQVFEGVQRIYMAGGENDDTLTLIDVGVPVTALGGPGNDKLVGTAFIDYLDGGPGHDVIRGRGDRQLGLDVGAQGDKLYGGPGDDLIYGDFAPGDDPTGWGTAGGDLIDGGSGQDIVYGGAGDDTIDGGPQRDVLFGGRGDDIVSGGSGQDLLIGGAGEDLLSGLDGNDILLGELVSDTARDPATNTRFVNLFNTVIAGMPHPALFQTNLFSSLLTGDTRSTGDTNQDTLKGGTGNDLLIGDVGGDYLYGGWGNDTIIGHLIGSPNDASGEYIEGNPGDDFICGADGIDSIYGGTNATSKLLSGLADVLSDAGQAESAGGFTLTSCTQTTDIVVVPAPVFSVRGVIYEDGDRGGLLDTADKLLGGWTLELVDPQNQIVATTVSFATSGQFEFMNVTPGQYTVREVLPIGWVPVAPTIGTRSVPVAGGSTSSIIGDIDFGNRREQGQIIVRQFHDLNGDGNHDSLEPWMNNSQVEIVGSDGSILKRTENLDRNGDGLIAPNTEASRAVFEGLPAGKYTVREIPRSGWVQSFPSLDYVSANNDARLTIPDDGVSELRSSVTVSGTASANGVADSLAGIAIKVTISHPNVSDLEAYLIAPDGRLVKLFTNVGGSGDNFNGTVFKTFTQSSKALRLADGTEPFQAPFGDSDGYRAEEDLGLLLGMDPRGEWTLVILDSVEETAGALLDWSLNLIESTGNVVISETYVATQASVYQPATWNEFHVVLGRDAVTAVEFGNYQLATIHGFKFADLDGNRNRESNEPGLGGITLFADMNDNGVRDRGEPRASTLFDDLKTSFKEAGYFSIGSVKPGTYKIREELSSHYRQTVPVDDGMGSVTPITVTLLSGATIGHSVRDLIVPTPVPLAPGLIFANQPLGEILGRKTADQNRNGQWDSGEPGLSGVTVFADLNHNARFDAGEPSAVTMADDPATLQIDESGRYMLPNLPSGTYEIREVVPAGYMQTSGGIDILYANTFEGQTVGPEWSQGNLQHTPYGARGFLGNFGNETATLKVTGVPDNADVTISFDLFVLGSWKGSAEAAAGNQDRFRFLIAGVPQLDTAFSNLYGLAQSFPDSLGVGTHPARTGAIELDTLGFGSPANRAMDAVYHFEFTHVNGIGDLLLGFSASGLPNITDVLSAKWGIDNVVVTTPANFHEIQLGPGKTVDQVDFSNGRTGGEIHGVKFNDLNGNGVREPGEPGLAGVRIYLDANNNGKWEQNEISTFTMSDDPNTHDVNETGMYWLTGLSPGQYDVRELVPTGWQQTSTGSMVFYQNDFERGGIGSEWSNKVVSVAPNSGRQFLGLLANETVTLQLPSLPPHQQVSVSADLYLVGSWDGSNLSQGPDRWQMRKDGQLLVNTTFSNIRNDGTRPPTWQNPKERTDVDNDGTTIPLDVLVVINDLNRNGTRRLDIPATDSLFLDTDNDGYASPLDVLVIINWINLRETPPVGSVNGYTPQAYPDTWPIAEHPARTGAVENNTLGYGAYAIPPNDPRQISLDSVYALQQTFAHTANSLTLDFAALGLSNDGKVEFEKWGLDNVVVSLLGDARRVNLKADQVVIGIDFGNKPSTVESEGPGTLNISIADASFFENAGPGATTAIVTRSDSAGDLTLFLSSSDTSEATVSAFVFIPNGKTSVTFPIAAADDTLLDGTQVVTIIASASGYSNGSDTLNVLDKNNFFPLPPVAVDDRVTVVTNAPSTIADPAGHTDTASVFITLQDPVLTGKCVSIAGQKFNDKNENGVHDPGEPGMNDWTIQLVNAAGQVAQSTTTMDLDLNLDSSIDPQTERGIYRFTSVAPGAYTVREVMQPNWTQSTPAMGSHVVLVPGESLLYTVTNTNELAAIDVATHSVVTLGVTQDSPAASPRRIRGLAYDSETDVLYGMTREGNLVTVDRTTGQTTFVYSLVTGSPNTEFWSGLTFDGKNHLYTTNAYGRHELVQLALNGSSITETSAGSTTFGAGSVLQILGLDFYPASAPSIPATFNGTHPKTGVLYGSNRTNNNFVVVDPVSGAVTMPFGNHTVGVNNLQEIAFHPGTGELFAIHDHFSQSNNAALSVFNFTTETATEWGELPFGIVESLGPLGGTYGWGGLAFAPASLSDNFRTYDFGNFQRILLPDGDDLIYAHGGADTVYGDNFISNPSVVSVGTLADRIYGGDGDDHLFGQEKDDVLAGEVGHDILNGGVGIDRVEQTVNANQTLTDGMVTGQGDDTLMDIDRATLTGDAGVNVINASAFTRGPVVLVGLEGNDNLTGTIFDDRYVFLDAASSAELDTLTDSGGVDLLDFSAITTKVTVDLTQASMMAKHGTRTITTSDPSQFENVWGGNEADDITGNAASNEIRAGGSDDIVHGGPGRDALFGDGGRDSLFGDAGDDTLSGGAGDDVLQGGSGNDTFLAGPAWGSDSIADSGGLMDTLQLSDVTADLIFTIDASGLHAVPTVEINTPINQITHGGNSIENVISGSGDDQVRFVGLATLASSQGVIRGGLGNNTLDYRSYNTGIMVDLMNNQAQGTASVFDFIDVFGSNFDDNLTGNANNNLLVGGAGRDSLFGADGHDRLVGGADDDNLAGGAGDDVYVFEEVTANTTEQDSVIELAGGGRDHVDFGTLSKMQFVELDLSQTNTITFAQQFQIGGSPTLKRTLNLPSNQLGQKPDIEIASTGAGNDTLVANGAQNTQIILSGGSGDDRYRLPNGLTGDVTLVEDATTFSGGISMAGGLDTVDFSAFTTGVTFHLSLPVNNLGGLVLRLKNRQNTDAPLHFENLTGGSGDDQLFGNRLANVIQGGAGNNHLYGRSGDDTYFFVNAVTSMNTYLFETSGTVGGGLVSSGGRDMLDFSAITTSIVFDLRAVKNILTNNNIFLLGDGSPTTCTALDPVANCINAPDLFENIRGALNAANILTGNQNDNLLVGGNAIDKIYGQGGSDILIGLIGDDRLHGNDGRDLLFGGLGQDDLAGGSGDDILVGGYTIFDAMTSHRELKTIRAAWLSTENTYTLRIDRIMSGLGLGTTNPALRPRLKTTPLNQSVFDDFAVDELVGDGNLDWFLSNVGDNIGPLDPGE